MRFESEKLFFVALLPESAIQEEVTAFKQIAQERFGSGHALKSPPHITLIPPFRSHQNDFSALERFANEQPSFPVQLHNFDRFGNRVIFVNVVENALLRACQHRLAAFCAERFKIIPDVRFFHPHMTVAFKDLKRSVFPEAWEYFSAQSYERTFTASALTLLMHTGQRWEIEEKFPFL